MSGFGFSLDGIKSKLAEAGEKVKARVNEIDAGRMRETLAKAGATAQESISHVSTLGAAQLHETTQQARQLADRQAKQLSKVNAKALLNSNAHFGVPLEALAFSSADAEATEVASVPLVLEMMLAYFESTPRITSVSQLFSVTANASVGVTALAKAMDTDIKTVKLSQQTDPAVVAALLRMWVVELPEPLLTFRLYDSFLDAFLSRSTEDAASATARTEALSKVVGQLPYANWLTAKRLLSWLRELLVHDASGLQVLAVNFGPALLRPRKGKGGGISAGALRGLMEDLPLICDVAEALIAESARLFDTYPKAQESQGNDAPDQDDIAGAASMAAADAPSAQNTGP